MSCQIRPSMPIPAPNATELLPPLLSCLPLAVFSPQPPPSLLPLLTPILRQRISVRSTSATSSWISLLTWNRDQGAALNTLLDEVSFEPHPVSGELELEDVEPPEYLRLDEETLQSRFRVPQFDLLATYLWSMNNANDGASSWLLTELQRLDSINLTVPWLKTINDAENVFKTRVKQASRQATPNLAIAADDEDDGSYWAAYDQTPANRTPANRTPANASQNSISTFMKSPATNDSDYFQKYNDVQPALDPYDPDEDPRTENSMQNPQVNGLFLGESDQNNEAILSPRPTSSSSSSSKRSIENLEEEAKKTEHNHNRDSGAEMGIRQHISTDIKSLYRLCRAVGIPQDEFKRILITEMELLSMMDLDE